MGTDLLDRLSRAEGLFLVGVAVVLASMPLPWLDADRPVIAVDGSPQSSITGLEAPDGQLVLGFVAIVTVIVAVDRYRTPAWGWVKGVASVLGGLVATTVGYMYVSDPARGAEGSEAAIAAVESGTGLYVVVLGGLVMIAAGVLGLREESTAAADETPSEAVESSEGPAESSLE